ncbi:MAG: tripartite tricarboxylate transporter substrate-binding protein [Defluviitaleaceae bacterium]|nr:tripartite tricarboxylate transporter substrate-binding protein [Defluviitaleaceae bacterium]
MKKLLALILLLGLTLAACGSSDEPTAPTPTAPPTGETTAPAAETPQAPETGEAEAPGITGLDSPVTVIVPFPAGSAMDVRARIVARYAEPLFGQTVTIENLPGAGGIVGTTEFVLRSGEHHLLFANVGVFSSSLLFTDVGYSLDDIIPIVSVDMEQFGLFAAPGQSGIHSVDDIRDLGRNVRFAAGAPGTVGHVSSAIALEGLGITGDHMVVDGAVAGNVETLGGHNDINFSGLGLARDFVEEGTMVPVLTFNAEDFTGFDGMVVPSLQSLGVDYSFESMTFFSMRSDTAPEIVDFIQQTLSSVLQNADCLADLYGAGVEVPHLAYTDEIIEYISNIADRMREYGPRIGLTLVQ